MANKTGVDLNVELLLDDAGWSKVDGGWSKDGGRIFDQQHALLLQAMTYRNAYDQSTLRETAAKAVHRKLVNFIFTGFGISVGVLILLLIANAVL